MKLTLSTKVFKDELLNTIASDIKLEQIDFIKTSILELNYKDLKDLNFDSIIITSQKSALAIQQISELKNTQILCVGIKTKALLIKNGNKVFKHYKNAQELVNDYENTPFYNSLYLKGNLALPTIENKLNLSSLITYRTDLTPQKIEETKYSYLLFFSPSGVESYYSLNKIIPNQIAICIGNTTAKAVKAYHSTILIAPNNSILNMLKIIKSLTI